MAENVTLADICNELKFIEEKMATREDLEALVDTVEILSNPATVEALRRSDEDIKAGRTRKVTGVQDMLDELRTQEVLPTQLLRGTRP